MGVKGSAMVSGLEVAPYPDVVTITKPVQENHHTQNYCAKAGTGCINQGAASVSAPGPTACPHRGPAMSWFGA